MDGNSNVITSDSYTHLKWGRATPIRTNLAAYNSIFGHARCDSSTQNSSSGHRPSVGFRSFTVSVWNVVTGVQRLHSPQVCFKYSLPLPLF